MALYKNSKRIAGNGKSAYQYAVDGGYTDTEQNFIEDLKNINKLNEMLNKIVLINNLFKIKNITLTNDMFTDGAYILENAEITSESFINVYYASASISTAESIGIVSESIDGGIKFTIATTEAFSIVIDAILVMNIESEGGTGSGFNIYEYIDSAISAAITKALGGCTIEIINNVPHICWDDGEVTV